eukprot:g16842.t1
MSRHCRPNSARLSSSISSKLEMPDTLSLPVIPKGASHQARPAHSKDPSPVKAVHPEDSQEDSPLDNALRKARRAHAFGSQEAVEAEPTEEFLWGRRNESISVPKKKWNVVASEDSSPIGSALRKARRAHAYGQEGEEMEAEEPMEDDSSPLGSSLRAVRRARAFAGHSSEPPAEEMYSAEADHSPLASALRAIRRARAFGGDVAAVRAQLDTNEPFEAEEEDSPLGSQLRAVRRARAFGALTPPLVAEAL